jgi:hypothetical protein
MGDRRWLDVMEGREGREDREGYEAQAEDDNR